MSDPLYTPSNSKASFYLLIALLNYPLLFFVIRFLPLYFSLPLGLMLAVRTFNCLAQVTHFTGHGTFFLSSKLNHVVGTFTSALMGYEPEGMWLTHFDHHDYLNTEKDGDLALGSPNQSPKDFLKGFLFDIVGWNAFKRAFGYYERKRQITKRESAPMKFAFVILLAQGLLLYLFFKVGGFAAYIVFYVLPLATLYPAQARIRSLVEHHVDQGGRAQWCARSTHGNLLERIFLAPFGQNYHREHHLYPQVPGYYLKDLHARLNHTETPLAVNPSYAAYLFRFLWSY